MTRGRKTDGSDELEELLPWAKRAAARVSADPGVVDPAAYFALAQYHRHKASISSETRARRGWVGIVAANEARRLGAKLHRDVAFGKAGSLIPLPGDAKADAHVGRLITEMHIGGGRSLSSLVTNKVEFDRRVALLSLDQRALLRAKYVEGLSSKDIARERGVAPGTIDNQLLRARKALRLVLEDLDADDDHD